MPRIAISAPARIASVRARSPSRLRNSAIATSSVIPQTTEIETAMTDQAAVCSGVVMLKWLVSPSGGEAR